MKQLICKQSKIKTKYYYIKKEDIPLLKVILEEKNNLIGKEKLLYIKKEISIAHKLDSCTFDEVNNTKYLSNKRAEELLEEINKQIKKIEHSNSKYKNLLIEQCKTAQYEVLILSGYNISSLLRQINSEEDIIALTKAYYNISNIEFRINSGYFITKEATEYSCRTSNPQINQKILDIKLKRRN